MSANTTLSGAARNRLFAFNGTAWIAGLILIAVISVFLISDAVGETSSSSDDYYGEPWVNPDPPIADDEGDGVFSGTDGAKISLQGLDPSRPLLITALDDTYVAGVWVTGPDGEILTPGEYGDAPSFDAYNLSGEQWVLVPQADVALWVDGFSDERFRLKITTPEVEKRTGVVSGIGSTTFFVDEGVTTARVSMRGDGHLYLTAVTVAGQEEVFSSTDATDKSIAWADSDIAMFVVDASDDTAWTIDFPTPAAAPTPAATPTEGTGE
ncbi:hypothetical protein JNB62_02440 [Microbacterium jejuense]|uniref:Uncharacterized protein n=1 Tax=Microbacterium jejuense TaxID=1263637 RepID=A0ABS7HIA3_9MICO|nr:hypothetical protein [Microbacterium jejuense]MBW9092538.1 hypothetical protein [Microbacterium jejuense]